MIPKQGSSSTKATGTGGSRFEQCNSSVASVVRDEIGFQILNSQEEFFPQTSILPRDLLFRAKLARRIPPSRHTHPNMMLASVGSSLLLSAAIVSPATRQASRSHGLQMSSQVLQGVTFEAADAKSLPEVSSFFVDAFWQASTTFDAIELTASDRRQLLQKVSDDLGPRYGIANNDKRPTMMGGRRGFPSKSLFETRLVVAREPSGAIVGCAGIEAAFYEPNGQVFRSDQADRLVRAELNAMEDDEAEEASKVYAKSGIGGLSRGIIREELTDFLVQPYMKEFTTCSLLANVAVAPSFRRTGLGRALCDQCVLCTTEDWKIDEIALQVEEDNTAAITLYQTDGYKEVFRSPGARALRLQPSEPNVFGGLPGPFSALAPENKKLLKEISSPTLTMSKKLA